VRHLPITRSIALGLLFTVLVPLATASAHVPTCQGLPATIWGDSGDNTLIGTAGDDVIAGKGGNDTIDGGGGNDVICGGQGDDTIDGGDGADLIRGGGGSDTIDGGTGRDHISGGPDGDRLRGGTGGDVIRGGAGPDDIVESTKADVLPEADPDDRFVYANLTLTPKAGSHIGFSLYEYSGPIEVRSAPDGLVVVEHVAPETYLLGIDEMPFFWHGAALEAQAIAARTYLANLVAFPRWGLMAKYGFDICDTTSCQVYEGIGVIDRTGGANWQAAVEATAGQILLYDGKPAATLYHSASGSATRSIEDVWGGSPVPYLTAVPIADEGSVFSYWTHKITLAQFTAILADAGVTFDGPITKVRTRVTATGGGPYTYKVFTDSGMTVLTLDTVRSALNTHGPTEAPADLPGEYAPGKKYPASAMSPTFTVRTNTHGKVVIKGEGYGHQLGMSQYGAESMGAAGATAAEILEHFYTGLTPEPDPGFLPDVLEVGIGWQWLSVTLHPYGEYVLRGADGIVAKGNGGSFFLLPSGDEVVLVP
jgi:SpoIID/LytB domain protein